MSRSNNCFIDKDVQEDYQLGEIIGSGNFGFVYHATSRHNKEENEKAIKHLNDYGSDAEMKEGAAFEIEIQQSLDHPNIVKIENVYRQTHFYWLVMPKFEINVKTYIKKNSPVDQKLIRKWIKQILDAVAYCHESGIVHRDIKPENLLLDKENNIHLTDFGSARRCPPSSSILYSSYRHHFTTLGYCAPEILSQCSSYDHSIDVWSIGCVFYELMCGYNIFENVLRSGVFDILDTIFYYLGTPTEDMKENNPSYWPEFCNTRTSNYMTKHNARMEPFERRINNLDARDLLLKMLCLNRSNRISCKTAIKHTYFIDSI